MQAMNAEGLVALQQVDEVAGTSNSGNDNGLLDRLLGLDEPSRHCLLQRTANAEVAASGAPLEIIFGILVCHTATPSFLPTPIRSSIRRVQARNTKRQARVLGDRLRPYALRP